MSGRRLRRAAAMAVGLALALPGLQSCAPIAIGGATAAAGVANDRRTAGALVEDQVIEAKVLLAISEALDDQVEVGAISFNRVMLLTGQAPTPALRNRVEEIAEGIENVRQIHNRITIANPSSLTQGVADAAVTSKVKVALLGSQVPGFSGLDIKVVTELGVVYLMGIVTQEQAATAVDITRNVSGVLNVVKIFEYPG